MNRAAERAMKRATRVQRTSMVKAGLFRRGVCQIMKPMAAKPM